MCHREADEAGASCETSAIGGPVATIPLARTRVAAEVRHRQFAALLEHSPLATMILDAAGGIREWNGAAESLLGWSRWEILGARVQQLIPLDGVDEFERAWAILSAGGPAPPQETVRMHRDGTRVPVNMHVTAIQEADGGFAGVVATLSNLAVVAEQPAAIATDAAVGRQRDGRGAGQDSWLSTPVGSLERDDVTGLPGRRWIQRRLAQPVAAGHGRGLAVLDVDAFALVNQDYGPDVAEDVLRQLAGRLQEVAGVAAVGRWQADEFVCIVDALDPETALDQVIERLLCAARETFPVGDDKVRLTLSSGLVTDTHVPLAGLFSSAAAALDAAKSNGRNRAVWFDPATHQHSARGGLRLANDLQRGIAEGELRLHFQPIVALATNDVIGVEALVRWERPGVGLLAPDSFIEVAERTGQIVALGAWVAEQACLAAVQLTATGVAPLVVSINVSARQLSDPDLLNMLTNTLADTGCPPSNIAIEVTETALLHDMGAATAVLEAIEGLGIALDLDDFGTGYSSLLYLKHFPVNRIKIDRSFVNGLGTDAADTAIVASTIALAHSVGLGAVAEGVETAEQLTALRQMGCDFAQGYLLSRPLPLDQLHVWLAEHVPSRLLPRGAQGSQVRSMTPDRDKVADERDKAADQRDDAGEQRDHTSDQRDHVADQRDEAGDRRDRAADVRDRAADQRDRANVEGSHLSARALREAETDRSQAVQDRGLGADQRVRAEHERDVALTERGAETGERLSAGRNRKRALSDRAASAKARGYAAVDVLTGGLLRDAGMLALQHEMRKALHADQSLVVACIQVGDLADINRARGHTGGDAVLVVVANALTASLRSNDLIIRYGPDQFVCAFRRLRADTAARRLSVIQRALAGPPQLGTVTVGLAELKPDDSPSQLISRAIAALGVSDDGSESTLTGNRRHDKS